MNWFVNFHLRYCPFSDIGILYRNILVNKLSEDRLMLEFTYLAYKYKLWCRWTDYILAFFLKFLLTYVSLSCRFMSVSHLITLACSTILLCLLEYSILSHNLGRSSGHHRWIRNNPFPSCPVFSCPSRDGKVHSCPLFDMSSHLFFCLHLFLFLFTVPCRIVFAKPEDLETWPNHLSFCFLTRVRSSLYFPMAAWIFLRTSSLVTWSLYEMFHSLR